MPHIENFEEFKARQNCEAIQVQQGEFENRWVFENGAGCILKHLGLRNEFLIREPSTDRWELLRDRREFVVAKLHREKTAYESRRVEFQQMAIHAAKYPHSCPPPPATAMDELRARWDCVEALQKELEQIDIELGQHPAAVQRSRVTVTDAEDIARRNRIQSEFAQLGPNTPPPPPVKPKRPLLY